MSKSETPVLGSAMAELREQLDAQARFRKVLMGFDPQQVNGLLKSQKEFTSQLESELVQVQQDAQTYRAEAEARFAAQSADLARLRQDREERGARLEETQHKLDKAAREVQAVRAELQHEAEQLALLRESVELRHLERMRAQLIAATRESSESTVQLTAARQEIKHLKSRLSALTTDYEAASAALEEERARQQSWQLALDRTLTRAKARTHQLGMETATRLRETAELITASLAENEDLLSRLEEPAARLSCLPAQTADETVLPA